MGQAGCSKLVVANNIGLLTTIGFLSEAWRLASRRVALACATAAESRFFFNTSASLMPYCGE